MSQVDQENETKEQEQDSTDQSDIVAPEDEESVRDQEGDDNETNPSDQLGPPETILNSRSLVACVLDANQQESHDEVEEAESKVDTVDSGKAIAGLAVAGDCSEVEQNMLEFLDSPVGEHDPGQERVEQQDDGVGDTGGHAVVAFSSSTADGGAGGGSTAAGGEGHELYTMSALKVAQEDGREGSFTEPTEGTAKSGSDKRAPMASLLVSKTCVKISRNLVRGSREYLEESGS